MTPSPHIVISSPLLLTLLWSLPSLLLLLFVLLRPMMSLLLLTRKNMEKISAFRLKVSVLCHSYLGL